MPNQSMTAEMFEALDGRVFKSYADVVAAVSSALGARRHVFPAHYRPGDAVAWARENGWLIRENGELAVRAPKAT